MKWLACVALLACIFGCKDEPAALTDFNVVPIENQAQKVRVSDFKGKLVLLDFWATWCEPCRMAMPEVQSLYERFGDKGLEIMSISDEEQGPVMQFHKASSYTYPVYRDVEGKGWNAYAAESIPVFMLVRDGKILWKQVGYEEGSIAAAVSQYIK